MNTFPKFTIQIAYNFKVIVFEMIIVHCLYYNRKYIKVKYILYFIISSSYILLWKKIKLTSLIDPNVLQKAIKCKANITINDICKQPIVIPIQF